MSRLLRPTFVKVTDQKTQDAAVAVGMFSSAPSPRLVAVHALTFQFQLRH